MPNHAASITPNTNQEASDEIGMSKAFKLPSPDFPPPMGPNMVDLVEDNLNKRFSKFSFVPSYATSSAGEPSTVKEEHSNAEEASRFGSVSTASEYPPGTSMKVRSPPPGNRPPKNSVATDAESLLNGTNFLSSVPSGNLDMCESESEIEIALVEDPVLASGIIEENKPPVPDRNPTRKPATAAAESGNEALERLDTPDIIVQSPKKPMFAHAKEGPKSPRAEKALRVPFLHKFRRSHDESKETPILDPQNNIPHGQEPISSFFVEGSSDDEDYNDDKDSEDGLSHAAFLGNAQQASFRRPVLVNHRTASPSPQLGLRDILDHGSGTRVVPDVSPLGEERNSMLDPALSDEDQRKKEARRSGVIGWPASEQQLEVPQTASGAGTGKYEQGDERVSALWTGDADTFQGPASAPLIHTVGPVTGNPESRVDGLRSHPTNAKSKPPKRQVTFPLSIQAIKEKNWDREDIISTPYPSAQAADGEHGGGEIEKRTKDRKANLTVIVYGRGESAPKMEHLRIPAVAHQIPIKDSEKGEKAIMNKDFDDATLARLLFSAYKAIRGSAYASCSARTVRSVRLLGYENNCQLATKRAKQQCFKNKEEEEGFAHTSLINLYQNPKRGKGKWIWWAWVRGLPENSDQDGRSGGKVALELVEGWSVKRIVTTLALVAFCSVLATLLWIVAGVTRVTVPVPTYASSATALSMPVARSLMSGGVSISATTHVTYSDISGPGVGIEPNTYPPSQASAFATGSPAAGISVAAIVPTVLPRDTVSTSTWATSPRISSSGGESATSVPAQDIGRGATTGGPGGRLGPGVGLGALVLLFGWMIVGAWVAVSWMVA